MKLIYVFVLLILTAIFVSCKKESALPHEGIINNTAKIYGVVRDKLNNAAITALSIELKKSTVVISSTTSNDSGSFCFADVASGSYFVHFYKSGCYFHDSIQINVKAALNYNYDVVLVKDAHSTSTASGSASTINSINTQMQNSGCVLQAALEVNF